VCSAEHTVCAHQRYKLYCISLRFETSSKNPWPTLVFSCRQDNLINVDLFSRPHQLCALESHANGIADSPESRVFFLIQLMIVALIKYSVTYHWNTLLSHDRSDYVTVLLSFVPKPIHSLTHCGRVTQICVFNTVKLGTSASSP